MIERRFNSFNELYAAPAFGSVVNDSVTWNESPNVGEIVEDGKPKGRLEMTPTCFCDDRMHVHVKTRSGEIEFWLETNGTPVIALKDNTNFKGNVREILTAVQEQQKSLIRKWLAYAKDHETGHKYFSRAWDFAKKYDFVGTDETFDDVKKEIWK